VRGIEGFDLLYVYLQYMKICMLLVRCVSIICIMEVKSRVGKLFGFASYMQKSKPHHYCGLAPPPCGCTFPNDRPGNQIRLIPRSHSLSKYVIPGIALPPQQSRISNHTSENAGLEATQAQGKAFQTFVLKEVFVFQFSRDILSVAPSSTRQH
jgi:hypothetical protein